VARFVLALAVCLLVFLDVQALLQTLHSQARVREKVARTTREAVLSIRPRLQALFDGAGVAGVQMAAEEAVRSALAREIEVFDLTDGRRVYSYPAPVRITHWPGEADLAAIRAGQVVTVGPLAGPEPRLLAYALFRTGGDPALVRFAMPVPEVVEDLRERREILVGHAISLALLIVTLAVLLLPQGEAAAAPPRALDAYEEAMERLRDQGLALSREHAAERLKLEERLAASAPLARAGELTAGMAHEVRNGLGTILGYARLLERGAPRAEAEAAARAIREECEALETVVRRFVDFVKDETLRVAPFDLRRTLSRVAARESRSGPGAEAILVPGGPEAFGGDEEMLERAFENLVRNGLEAAGEGGHVWIQVGSDEKEVRLEVSDDGPGLSPGARGALRPFLTTKAGGLGLGLPIVYKIIGLHGGEILMGERRPRGLAVSIRLPRLDRTVTGSSERAQGPDPGKNS
jgi:signal transduction histidine kinase